MSIEALEAWKIGIQQLVDALSGVSSWSIAETADGFDRIYDLAGALPLTTNEYCFAVNWIASARQLWETDEYGAARYQIDMVRRKLMRPAMFGAIERDSTDRKIVRPDDDATA